MYPGKDPLYKNLRPEDIPLSESLKDTWQRIEPFWKEEILPSVKQGRKVLLSVHGSTIRALIKVLDNLSDKEIENLNIPTGTPLLYQFDDELRPLSWRYLGDSSQIKRAVKEVASQSIIK